MTRKEIKQLKLCLENYKNYDFTVDGDTLIISEDYGIIIEADMEDIIKALGIKFEYA